MRLRYLAGMASLLNLLLPGTGLILLRKEWFGLTISLLFAICVNLAIAGAVIAPAAIPAWLTWIAATLSIVVWAFSQIVCRRQKLLFAEARQRVAELLREAKAAQERGDDEAARIALDAAAAMDFDLPDWHAVHSNGRSAAGVGPRH